MATTTDASGDLAELRRSFAGVVVLPEEPGYDILRRSYNALIDRRPAVIARCFGADDVATALDYGRSNSLEIAVRGGGHNPAGHCVCDDGLVIDLSLMRRVDVDPDAGVAHSQGGATWLDFDRATQAHGLITPGGVVGTTGVAGLTFGGGIGHLTAQHGLTCDNLLAAEIVTPNGDHVRASADDDTELFWGIRGGGGNFGVATKLEFRLHPLRKLVGGRMAIRGRDNAVTGLRAWRDVCAEGPRDLSLGALLAVDDALEVILILAPGYTGTESEPEQIARLRQLPGIVADGIREHSFIAQQHLFNPPYGEDRNYWKGHFVRELPDELIDELLDQMLALGRSPGQILFESIHGVPDDADPDATAIGFREAKFNISSMAGWQDPAVDAEHIEWARATAKAMEPHSLRGGGYINYMQADEPIERVRATFGPERFDRLQALKARFDPDNVLRRNQNIPPA